ncbi:hypothetical protein D3874_26585 [Oleomonas cavernae]|uniref:PDZ domain-containing protein n=1 Tax=Oleomonas cavernae TaxID=2320859 RepID=A0A418VU58_9PROT|nr:hypothetical protein [Oleomonas cavernae]RJF80669.1 hypothetical protein D3874_26585 [Oleomonas cavernae]
MHIAIKAALILGLLLPQAARANMIPPQPPPLLPPGPAQATLLGLTFEQLWSYRQGGRWAVAITGCAQAESPACRRATEAGLIGCHVVGANGKAIAAGDLQAIIDAHAYPPSTAEKPLRLTVEACRDQPTEITLEP